MFRLLSVALGLRDGLSHAKGKKIAAVTRVAVDRCFSTDPASGKLPAIVSGEAQSLPRRVLLVEDNPTNAYVAMEFLTGAGYEVQHASNGQEAVEAAANQKFDIILMDISMPIMDGIQATAIIRSLDSPNVKTPIIALTAHVAEGDGCRFTSAQMDGYLTKPIRKVSLLEAINSYGSAIGATAEAKSGSNDGVAIIERAIFRDFIKGRSIDRVVRSLSIFVTELKQKASSLASIISRQDAHALRMLTHSAVGSASMLGAARLVAQSRSIEAACMGKEAFNWSDAEGLARTMEETIAALAVLVTEEALDELRAKHIEAA